MFVRSLLIGLLCLSGAIKAHAADLVVYTEHYPPFNYADEQGTIQGLATDKVRQVLDATGLSYEIRLVPWARAMKNVLERENALIYTITRIPEREAKFDWLVPLAGANFHLFARADDQRTITYDKLLSGAYTVVCVASDLTCGFLKTAGVPEKSIISVTKAESGTTDFRLVIAGRADMYLSEMLVNGYFRKSEGYDPAVTKPVLKMDMKTGFYLASGMHMQQMARDHIRQTYEKLRAAGKYQLIETGAKSP